MKLNKSKNYLFVCCTPLQGLIAKRIIEKEKLSKDKCVLFFYTSFDNETYRKSYSELAKLCIDSIYYVWKPNFPRYIFEAKKFFSKYTFERFYFAALDSIFVQLALSKSNNFDIYTFDDGSANILKESHYYTNQKINFKRFVYILLGNRYSTQRIRKKILKHYTIYPKLQNISNHLCQISLFDDKFYSDNSFLKSEINKKQICNVVLGTVYEEIIKSNKNINSAKIFISEMLNDQTIETYYIKHPRESEWKLPNVQMIQNNLIAEEIIISLLQEFEKINLYSFGSTTQINFASTDGITNYFFDIPGSSLWLKSLREIESKITNKTSNIINIPLQIEKS